ncbi:MAG: hypothetical protein Q8N98_04005 [bacterium]|nr:hypothetical protein [bacterium]
MSPVPNSRPEIERAESALVLSSPEGIAMRRLVEAVGAKRAVGLGEWCPLVSLEGRKIELQCVGGMIVSGISLSTILDVYPPVSPVSPPNVSIEELRAQAERIGGAWGVKIYPDPEKQTVALATGGERFNLFLGRTPFADESRYFHNGVLGSLPRELLIAAMAVPRELFGHLRREGLLFQADKPFSRIGVPGSLLRHFWDRAEEDTCYPMDLDYGEEARKFLFRYQKRFHPVMFKLLP